MRPDDPDAIQKANWGNNCSLFPCSLALTCCVQCLPPVRHLDLRPFIDRPTPAVRLTMVSVAIACRPCHDGTHAIVFPQPAQSLSLLFLEHHWFHRPAFLRLARQGSHGQQHRRWRPRRRLDRLVPYVLCPRSRAPLLAEHTHQSAASRHPLRLAWFPCGLSFRNSRYPSSSGLLSLRSSIQPSPSSWFGIS
jgi:hypothetical protein